jgi:toxin-antitoxin system PIN domain toxin
MTAVALLDVSVLVALFHAAHIHHDVAHEWLTDQGKSAWASCPLTENGLLRILSHPARVDPYVPLPDLLQRFNTFCEHSNHQFWTDDLSFRDAHRFNMSAIHGHQQLTDVYLLGLAVEHDARFVTFDAHIPLTAVKGARKKHLEALAPAD